MAVVLVDYENVSSSRGMRGVEYLNAGDKLYVFYSACCAKIRNEEVNYIKNSNCDFKVVKLVKKGKNGLDFYIATTIGMEYEKGERQIVIVSNDKGYIAIADYINSLPCASNRRIIRSANIENGLAMLSDVNNEDRRRLIVENNEMRDLVEAQKYIYSKTVMRKAIEKVLKETKFEVDAKKIIEYFESVDSPSKKAIYTNYLHEYGLKEGLELYRILKNVI